MNDRIIAKDRYKKVARKSVEKKKKKLNNMYNINGKLKPKVKRKETIFSLTIVKIFMVLLAIFLLGIISKIILSKNNISISTFFDDDSKKLEKNYDLKVGVFSNEDAIYKSRNLIANDLYTNLATKSLVSINKDYSINYDLAKSIEKIDSLNYKIILDNKFKITSENVKSTIYKILSNKENIYYQKLQNISDIKILADYELHLELKNENPYFIYDLAFPIYVDDDIKKNVKNILFKSNEEANNITLNKNEYKGENINSISLNKYSDFTEMISAFKNGDLDITFVSSSNIEKLIGKYDYSIKKYRDGSSLFLLGNPNSELFKQKIIRQALLYSINREEIIKSLNNQYLELIDLPYINSNISYKYDITAANNLLISNGWTKKSGIYTNGNTSAILTLIVNKNDNVKVKVAENIKNMAELNGIRINIESLSADEIEYRVNNSMNYDLVLADVYIDNTPNILHLEKFLNVSDEINTALINVKSSNFDNIDENVNLLVDTLSKDVACIGIYATNTAVVYQNNISGLQDVSYMNIFSNINDIGKVSE